MPILALRGMRTHPSFRFMPLWRVGAVRFGVAPAWLPAQAAGLLGFGVLAYATVAAHVGGALDPIETLRVALVLLVSLDLTVLVHESGHAVAASLAGVSVRAVVLMPYGGAIIREATSRSSVARWIAAGGPLANVLAAVLCGALVMTSEDVHSVLGCTLMIAGGFQAINALANLLPVACLDGAHIFSPAR